MKNDAVKIRMATEADAEAVLNIYAPYIRETAVTFEYEVPSVEEFRSRIRHITKKYPYLVAEENGEIIGYSYADPFGERAAFSHSAETVIYIKKHKRGCGIGTRLYDELISILKRQHVTNINAAIAYTEREDAYLTHASPAFHTAYGFHKAAHFEKCGYKFGRWYDLIWMEKFIGEHTENPAAFCTVGEVLLKKE